MIDLKIQIGPESLVLVKNDKIARAYFFSKDRPSSFFPQLYEAGIFNGANNPAPTPVEGGIQVPQWEVLPYLESVAKDTRAYDDELISIVQDVSKKLNNNYRTAWFLVKILSFLPNEKISIDILDLIPTWFGEDTRYDTSLQGTDILRKLLPKFITPDPEDTKKVAQILKHVLETSTIDGEKNAFGTEKKSLMRVEHYWINEELLNNGNAEEIGKICTLTTILQTADILNQVLSHKHSYTSYDFTDKNKNYRLSLKVNASNAKQFSVRLCEIDGQNMTALLYGKKEAIISTIFEETINAENEKDFNKKFNTLLENQSKSPSIAISRGGEILYRSLYQDYSYIWISDLSRDKSRDMEDAEWILTYIVLAFVQAKASANIDEAKQILTLFIGDTYPYPVFKRIALVVIADNWKELSEWFFNKNHFGKQLRELFNSANYESEIKYLLEKNVSKMRKTQKNTIKKIIENGPLYKPKENEKAYVNRWKYNWYLSVKTDPQFGSEISELEEMVNEYEKKQKSRIPEKRVFEVVQILSLPTSVLIRDINKDIQESESSYRNENIENLILAFKQNPQKFLRDIKLFSQANYFLLSRFISAITDYVKDKNSIDWEQVLDFISEYLDKNNAFWKDYKKEAETEGVSGTSWVLSSVGKLLESGSTKDEGGVPSKDLPKVIEIAETILKKNTRTESVHTEHTYSHALNSPVGQLSEALMQYMLQRKDENSFIEKIQSIYDDLLKNKKLDAYSILGRYTPFLAKDYYNWIDTRVQNIKKLGINSDSWIAFTEGYLYGTELNKKIYTLMKPIFEQALEYTFKEQYLIGKLIQNIGSGYLMNLESLDEGMVKTLIESDKLDWTKELIRHFRAHRHIISGENDLSSEQKEELRAKIVEFWRCILQKYKDRSNYTPDEKSMLGDLSMLADLFKNFGKTEYEMLILPARFVGHSHDSPYFIEFLKSKCIDSIRDKNNARYIAHLYLIMIQDLPAGMEPPNYPPEKIHSIFEYLKSRGETTKLNEIISIYIKAKNFEYNSYLTDEKK